MTAQQMCAMRMRSRPWLRYVHASLLSEQARHDHEQAPELLASEQRQQERWRCESPNTDALYEYIMQLADCWLHVLAQPVNTAVSTAMQIGQLHAGDMAGLAMPKLPT